MEIFIPKQKPEEIKQIPHTQLNQIEESMQQEKDRPIYAILYELLSTYPTGLNLKEIFQQFLDYKLATSYDLKNIMKQNECFEYDVVEDIWIVKVNKISRYYKDELGNQAENNLSYVWLIGEEGAAPTSNVSDKEDAPIQETPAVMIEKDISTQGEELSTDSIAYRLQTGFIDPAVIKEEIDLLVIECFNNGEIKALEDSYRDAQLVYNYFKKVEQFLDKWKGKNL